MATEYLLQEDGASKLTLEDGSGFVLLESSTPGGGGSTIVLQMLQQGLYAGYGMST